MEPHDLHLRHGQTEQTPGAFRVGSRAGPQMALGLPTRSPCEYGCGFHPAVQQKKRSCGAGTDALSCRNLSTGEAQDRNPPVGSAWEHLRPRENDSPETIYIYLGVKRSCVQIPMTEYGSDLLECGALPQYFRGGGMPQYVRASKWSFYSCPSDAARHECRYGAHPEGSPRSRHTDKNTGVLNGRTPLS